jgi:hypothetical protein
VTVIGGGANSDIGSVRDIVIALCIEDIEFSKKFEMVLMEYSGAREKLIHEKNQKQKSRDTVPLSWSWSGL